MGDARYCIVRFLRSQKNSEDEQLVQNFRPISILPFLSKVFEKIMSNYIIEIMEENKLFYKSQFGFRKKHSTCHAIITLIEKVSKALDSGKIVVASIFRLKKGIRHSRSHNIIKKTRSIWNTWKNT